MRHQEVAVLAMLRRVDRERNRAEGFADQRLEFRGALVRKKLIVRIDAIDAFIMGGYPAAIAAQGATATGRRRIEQDARNVRPAQPIARLIRITQIVGLGAKSPGEIDQPVLGHMRGAGRSTLIESSVRCCGNRFSICDVMPSARALGKQEGHMFESERPSVTKRHYDQLD